MNITPQRNVTTEADREPWFVVRNGAQIDVHFRSFLEKRELTIAADLPEDEARSLVAEHNRAVVNNAQETLERR